jgi:hypothetical protein
LIPLSLPSRTVLTLSLGAICLLYSAIQWAPRGSGSPNRIFSPKRVASRSYFLEMVSRVSAVETAFCDSKESHVVFYDDSDVVVPYLEDASRHCARIRSTVVTPLSPAQLSRCDALAIRELHPTGIPVTREEALGPPGDTNSQWVQVANWLSDDGEFGFAAYRHRCDAAHVGGQP